MLRRLIFIALIVLFGPGPIQAADARTVLAATPIGRMDLPWWRRRFEIKQDELRARHPTLVFYGDSITQNWERHGPPAWADFAPEWQRFYGDRNAMNLGFIGDTTASLLWRIEHGEASGIAPKVAVILIGANNLGRVHWSATDTVLGIDTIIHALRQRLPTTQLLLLGVLPSERSAWATQTTLEINRALAANYQRVDHVTFVDVGRILMPAGKLNGGLFYDPQETPPGAPLHPTAQAQAMLSEAIEPTLVSLLGDRAHR